MEAENITLMPLTEEYREKFIKDNQWAFKYGAMEEFGKRDDHFEEEGEIISRKTIKRCLDAPNSEAYRIMQNGEPVGGLVLKINAETHRNELELLFVTPSEPAGALALRLGNSWKSFTPKPRFGRPSRRISRPAISIFTSTNADSTRWNSSIRSTPHPPIRNLKTKNPLRTTVALTECSVLKK